MSISEDHARNLLDRYLGLLQAHCSAESMLAEVVTDDFETGFTDGYRWRGPEGLRDFLRQRAGFFDERHDIKELWVLEPSSGGDTSVKTRLEFFLRRWEPPAARSEEFTGWAYHSWRLRRGQNGLWRVAAQLVDRFDHLNDNAATLFATPQQGLNRLENFSRPWFSLVQRIAGADDGGITTKAAGSWGQKQRCMRGLSYVAYCCRSDMSIDGHSTAQ
jgi:hypothetical protein